MTLPRARVQAWLLWWAVFLAVTATLRIARADFNFAQTNLVYVLVVLGAAASGNRWLGFALSCAGFAAIDYFFQAPYDTFLVTKSLDWVGLLAFLATAGVTAHLVTWARSEAAAARERTREVAWLSRVGAEALHSGTTTEALNAVAAVVRETLNVSHCAIYGVAPEHQEPELLAASGSPPDEAHASVGADRIAAVASCGRAAVVYPDGSAAMALVSPSEPDAIMIPARTALSVALPLEVSGRTVGVLEISNPTPFHLDTARRRLLSALAYYAALGVDRVRLVGEAERAAALREANRAKDMVLTSVSHDLRTPLTTIKALAQTRAAAGDDVAQAIEVEADRLSRLVANLLDLSRLKGGVFPITLEPNTAEDLIGAVSRQVTGLLNGKRLETSIAVTQPTLVGRFDFVQSLRILCNLIENALHWSPPHATVELSVDRAGSMLRFTVADRGAGVAPEDVDRIFEPFYRARGAPPDVGHIGLGLATARRLAELQGGSMHYRPRPGGGSLFVLELPAIEMEDREGAVP